MARESRRDFTHELFERVPTLQNDVNHDGCQRQLLLSRLVEQRFQFMRQTLDGGQI